jgi:HEAT repeat protein
MNPHPFFSRFSKPNILGPVIAIVFVGTALIIGCKSRLPSKTESIPLDGQIFSVTTDDLRKKSVAELVTIFTTNHDHTEFLSDADQAAWEKAHPGVNAPVILHDEQTSVAYELTTRGPAAKEAAPAMIAALEDPNGSVRTWAIRALEKIGPASPEVVPALVKNLYNTNVGFEAAEALVIISLSDTNVLPLVIARLETDTESPLAEYGAHVLEGTGAEAKIAMPVLIRLLENPKARNYAINTFCAIGPKATSAVPHLLDLYERLRGDDSTYGIRKMIVIALGRIGTGAKEAVPMLSKLQGYEELDAARALWRIDPQNTQRAVDVAMSKLRINQRFWDIEAICLLGEIGLPAKAAVPAVREALVVKDWGQGFTFKVAWALWRMDVDQKATVVPIFQEMRPPHQMTYPNEDIPWDAVGALWQIAPDLREELRPQVVEMLKGWKDSTMARTGRREMLPLIPALSEIAQDGKYSELRPWALLALRKLHGAGPEWPR